MLGLVAIMGAYSAGLGWLVARYAPRSGYRALDVAHTGGLDPGRMGARLAVLGLSMAVARLCALDTPLRGYAPVLGVYGVGLAAAISAGALVTLLLGTRVSRIVAVFVDRDDMGRGCVADTRRVDRAA